MADLPEPPIPAHADLTEYPYTPIFRARLFGSSFNAHATDGEWRAAVTLWLRSWEQIPASSLPDDDAELCNLAGFGRDLRKFCRVRARALHGWVKCSDGRLYHKFLAQKTMEIWERQLKQSDKGRKAANSRWETHAHALHTHSPSSAQGVPEQCQPNAIEGKGIEEKGIEEKGTPLTPRQRGARNTKPTGMTTCPPGWRPDAAGVQYATAHGVTDLENTLDRFRSYHEAKGTQFASWSAGWRTWCSNHQAFAARAGPAKEKPRFNSPFTALAYAEHLNGVAKIIDAEPEQQTKPDLDHGPI